LPHPAVTQAHVRNLHRHRRAVDQHDLAAPVELISLTGGKAERNEGAHRCRRPLALPHPGHSAAQCRSRLRNRAHAAPRAPGSASTVNPIPRGGPFWAPITPQTGFFSTPNHMLQRRWPCAPEPRPRRASSTAWPACAARRLHHRGLRHRRAR
jgi:hypothetical protein